MVFLAIIMWYLQTKFPAEMFTFPWKTLYNDLYGEEIANRTRDGIGFDSPGFNRKV